MSIVHIHSPSHSGNLSDYGSSWMGQLRVYLQGQARDAMRRGVKLNTMALRAKVTSSTLSKFIYMETKYPRATTLDGLIDALDLYEEVGRMMIRYAQARKAHA